MARHPERPTSFRLLRVSAAIAAILPLGLHAQSLLSTEATPTQPGGPTTALPPPPRPASGWITQPSLQLTVTGTDNGAQAGRGQERKDLITTLQPILHIARRGANFGLSAELGAEMMNYANNTQRDRVLPSARVGLNATAIDNFLYVDASADVRSSETDPYRNLISTGTPGNNSTDISSTYSVSPFIDYDVSPRVKLQARAEESLTTSTQGASPDLRAHRLYARLSQKPLPLGASVELSRQSTSYADRPDGDLTTEAIRATGSYMLDGQFLVGGIVGQERNDFQSSRESDAIYGVQFQWLPGPRTDVRATVEKRFFGAGWDVNLRHRTPFMSFALVMNREPVGYSKVSTGQADNDLNQYLDSILTTRFPNPIDRQVQVDELISSRNLSSRLPDAVDTLSGYPQLRSKVNATLVWLGARNTFSLSAYTQTLRRLTRDDGNTPSAVDTSFDGRQRGVAVEINRRLTPQTSLDAVLQWARATGLGSRDGDASQERSARVSMARNLSTRAGVSVGMQYQQLRTNVAGLSAYHQTTGFVAVNYRF